MNRVMEANSILTILEVADTTVLSHTLAPDYHGIVVETSHNISGRLEGTVVYFPGVSASELIQEETHLEQV